MDVGYNIDHIILFSPISHLSLFLFIFLSISYVSTQYQSHRVTSILAITNLSLSKNWSHRSVDRSRFRALTRWPNILNLDSRAFAHNLTTNVLKLLSPSAYSSHQHLYFDRSLADLSNHGKISAKRSFIHWQTFRMQDPRSSGAETESVHALPCSQLWWCVSHHGSATSARWRQA